MELLSPATPGSPPSEMSAPLSSLATSVPSVAVSPSVDEDRPLLFLTPPRPRDKQKAGGGHGAGGHGGAHQCSKRNSAHYNHGQDPSPPPSPLHIVEDDEYESTQEYEAAVAAATTPAADVATALPPSPSAACEKFRRAAATVAAANKRTKPNGIAAMGAEMAVRHAQAEPGSGTTTAAAAAATAPPSESSSEESSSSDESETEDERVGEDTPFLSIQNPAAGVAGGLEAVVGGGAPPAVVLRPVDGSRTNPALRLSPQEDLQVRLSSVMTNQDPIAV